MKKLFFKFSFIMGIITILAHNASSQCSVPGVVNWPGISGTDMYYAIYTDENTVYSGGKNHLFGKGTLTDGTWSFTTLALPGTASKNTRTAYFMPGTTVGFVGTDDAVLYKTTDGGLNFIPLVTFSGTASNVNWNGATPATPSNFNNVVFAPVPRQDFGIASTSIGLFVTTNGGSNWTLQVNSSNSAATLSTSARGNWFTATIKGNTAYAGRDDAGQIFYADIASISDNLTWNAINVYDQSTVSMNATQGKGRSIAVTPNGAIWNATKSNLLKASITTGVLSVVTVPGSSEEIRGVAFFDDNNGIFTNVNYEVFQTTNGGASWMMIPGTLPQSANDITYSPSGNTIAVSGKQLSATITGTFINSVVNIPQMRLQVGSVLEGTSTSICPGQSLIFSVTGINGFSTSGIEFKYGGNRQQLSITPTITYAPANAGAMMAISTLTGFCKTTIITTGSINLNISAAVTLSATIAGVSSPICEGTSGDLAIQASLTNTNVTWYKNGVVASATIPTLSGVYLYNTVVSTDLDCAIQKSITTSGVNVTVTSKVTPTISVSASSLSTCIGVNFTADGTNLGTATYKWYNKATLITGASGSILSNPTLANGDQIFVVASSYLACVSAATVTSPGLNITCSGVTGIEDEKYTEANGLFPNPATDFFSLKLKAGESWSLTNLDGKTLKEGKINVDTEITEPIYELPVGMYVVHIYSAKNISTLKLVKK